MARKEEEVPLAPIKNGRERPTVGNVCLRPEANPGAVLGIDGPTPVEVNRLRVGVDTARKYDRLPIRKPRRVEVVERGVDRAGEGLGGVPSAALESRGDEEV